MIWHATRISSLFNRLAPEYDSRVERSTYVEDVVVADAVNTQLKGGARVLDLGCGTGRVVSKLSRRLKFTSVGVDLSEKMHKAAQSNQYDELYHSDAITFLASNATRYDFILAASVMPFFHEPEPLLRLCRASLNDLGRMLFTFDVSQNEDVALAPNGIYRHSENRIRGALLSAGFVSIHKTRFDSRLESGLVVKSVLVQAD
jgi:predicted TPR repeat methyltransferase